MPAMHSLIDLSVASPMPKAEHQKRSLALRQALLQIQVDLHDTSTNALILIAGVDGGGKGETVQLLNHWMDPRWIRTHAFDENLSEEAEHPTFWRYWRRLPPRGEIAIFLSAWYSKLLLHRVNGGSDSVFARELDRVRRFEQMLSDDGTMIFKLWLHLDAASQEQRFRELEADPLQRWRVSARDWENWSRYDEFTRAGEEIIAETHTNPCAWHVIEASDPLRRAIESGETLLAAMRAHVISQGGSAHRPESRATAEPRMSNVLSINSAAALRKPTYREKLALLQARLGVLHRRAREAGVSVIGVFEGRDAAGKGGAIRRVVSALDARNVDVVRIGPPSDEEQMHHYLWRFWRRIPRAGYIALFDRSWYGRVLAERVEELAMPHEWQRAYEEINDFERQIVEHGAVLVKFWLQIDRDEQKRRFKERSLIPHKRWKLTEDDRRNRRLWNEYDAAIDEMLERTSTEVVPWTIVAANDKRHARLEVLRTLVSALEARLDGPKELAAYRASTGG